VTFSGTRTNSMRKRKVPYSNRKKTEGRQSRLGIARISKSKADYEEYLGMLFGESQRRPPEHGRLPLLDRNIDRNTRDNTMNAAATES
jgi:hypothetical protein